MSWTSNLLVIAHRTIDADYLLEALCSRASAGPIRVTLLAPAYGGRVATASRLDKAAQRLEAADISVEAVVGHPDPIVALDEVWRPYRYDEIVVATRPDGRARRLTLALPHRVERFTGVPVTHITAPVRAASRMQQVAA